MRLGLMLVNQHPPADRLVDRWNGVLAQVRLARSLEFDLIVFGQHYLVSEFAMLQPAVSLARAAAEAGTMRLGSPSTCCRSSTRSRSRTRDAPTTEEPSVSSSERDGGPCPTEP